MSMHPYKGLPEHCFFRSVAQTAFQDLDWMPAPKFRIRPQDRIVTAGSCFARNLAARLAGAGLNHYIAEPAPWFFEPEEATADGYGEYSCRYGNVYTVRQLRELVEQAFGLRPPIFDLASEGGIWFDLLRPGISSSGFESERHAIRDREWHLSRVKLALETAEVFVFTLGLTEAWIHARSGHVYPSCPGTARGTWDPDSHVFKNFSHAEVLEDLGWVCRFLAKVNAKIRILLTVSPVALVASHNAAANVIASSTYSKSVLRSAAGEIAMALPAVEYFPSYEMIAAPQSFGRFLAEDMRDAASRGVDLVMEVFGRTLVEPAVVAKGDSTTPRTEASPAATIVSLDRKIAEAAQRDCEELFNDTQKTRT